MGQQIGQSLTGAQCCQQESLENRRGAELQLWDEDGPDYACNRADGAPTFQDKGQEYFLGDNDWRCCRAHEDYSESIPTNASMLESLSYTPVRFDVNPTMDVERSHARYSKIVVHSTRARTQRRSKAWEEWLRAATAGRAIVLLIGIPDSETPLSVCTKLPAMYYLDRALTKLTILPAESRDIDSNESNTKSVITISVDNIQVICPATDFMLFFDQVEAQLDESEQRRAVLLQYTTEDTERKRVCFLEDSEHAKDRFVQALTALWLEKRNGHSMWF